MCMWVPVPGGQRHWIPGAGVIGGYESPRMDVGIQTLGHCKSSKALNTSHLSSPCINCLNVVLFIILCVWQRERENMIIHVCHRVYLKVRGQLSGRSSLLSLWVPGSDSSCAIYAANAFASRAILLAIMLNSFTLGHHKATLYNGYLWISLNSHNIVQVLKKQVVSQHL